jgi:hypothetical protein
MGQKDGAAERPIIICRPGTFTSNEGVEVTFTEADLASIAAAYDPAGDPAPLVIGHPTLDAPAYGWAERLEVLEDGTLGAYLDPNLTVPAFAEEVKAGRYRKVSPRFYLPDSAGNPKPGSLYLKHIGVLGAAAPAIKGLGTIEFAEDQPGTVITLETDNQEKNMSSSDKGGQGTVDFAEREAELARREAALQEQEGELQKLRQSASQALHASNVSFAEQLVAGGRLAPAGKPLLVGLLDQLEATKTVSFGEADGELTPAEALKKLLSGAVPLVSFGERAGADDDKGADGVSFAAPDGFTVDRKALELHAKAVELQRGNSNLSYLDAVRQAGG